MGDLSCVSCLALCPEVGLGVAGAEDRAAVLEHVQSCASCAGSLWAMTVVGEGLVGLVPPADPPAGFEHRVLAAIAAQTAPEGKASPGARSHRRPFVVAAAVVVAAALAVGGWLVGATTSSRTAPSSVTTAPYPVVRTASVVTAVLTSHHEPAGEVVLVRGAHPWISMSVDLGTRDTTLWCEVRDGSGRLVTMGAFAVTGGRGTWASPLPGHLNVRGALLVDRDGAPVASVHLR